MTIRDRGILWIKKSTVDVFSIIYVKSEPTDSQYVVDAEYVSQVIDDVKPADSTSLKI